MAMFTQRMIVSRATLVVAALLGAAPLRAQDLSFRAAVGPAIPADGTAERLHPGPAAMISFETRVNRAWSLRWDGEWSLLTGRSFPAGRQPDLRAIGASLNGLRRFSATPVTPYLLLGVGAYRLQRVGAPTRRSRWNVAVQAGFGIEDGLWDRVAPFLEVRGMMHLTDYASAEFTPSVYCPILIGVRIW